jgi:rhamnulokinase
MTAPRSCPADARALIAIDLGAESCRVSLLRWMEKRPVLTLVHRFPNAPRQTEAGLCWDLAAIESGIDRGLRKAARLAPEGIRSIAVDGWAVDYVRVNPTGEAVDDPFCYRDERTVLSQSRLHQLISAERLRTLTGVQLSRINTLYQLHCDTSRYISYPWLNLPEYILSRLGGRPVAELTNASHTQLLDLTTRTWSKEIFEAAGIPLETAPELVPPGTAVGHLKGSLTELVAFADTLLIAPATHDTASAIAGIPACGEEWAYISSGTWSLVGTIMGTPLNDSHSGLHNFTNLVAAGGRTLFHKSVNGMWLIRQCLEYWMEQGESWVLPDLIAAAELLPPPDALLDVDDPELLFPENMPGRITKQRHARGLPALEEGPRNAPVLAGLIFHSLAARYGSVLSEIAKLTGKTFHRIYIVGGASQNLFLNRLTETATGVPIVRASPESSTLGNFAVQLATLDSVSQGASESEISVWARVLAGASESSL